MTDPAYFQYLSCSGEFNADGVNDVEEFADMQKAMDICMISSAEKVNILKIIAGILHLGNIEFVEGEEANRAIIQDQQSLAFPAYLLVRLLMAF